MKTTNRHFTTFHIAGFSYWEGCIAFKDLKIGTELTIERESENKFDPYAVAIYFGEYKLGFIPRGDNKEINKFLELGYNQLFEVRINQLSAEAHPEQQVGVIVYLKPNKNE